MSDKELIKILLDIPFESRTLEFKRLGSHNKAIDRTLESIVAMTNIDGGDIFIGVSDPKNTELQGLDRIVGVEENPELLDALGRTIQKISPPISGIWPPRFIHAEEKDTRVAWLHVPKATSGFHAVDGHVYVREETSNRRLSPQEIVHFAYVKGFSKADIEKVNVDFRLLDTTLFEQWRQNRGIERTSVEETLEKTGLALRVGAQLLPTRAAVLLFAEFPNDLLDTKCTIRIFQYEGASEKIGDSPNLLGVPKTISGPLVEQIRQAHEYVLTLLQTGIRVPSGFKTVFAIPERAVKEAITNAVIHRDYHTKRDIEIKIFEDRVEVESPGLLPLNITPANIGYERAHGYRNDLLVKHLREFPDPPNLDQNEGIRAMRKVMNESGLYPPIFITYPDLQDAVRVVLLNEQAPSAWEKISYSLQRKKYISNGEARKVLGWGDSVVMSKQLNRWVKKGLLIKIVPTSGYKRNIKYRLASLNEADLFTLSKSK
ncbi:MAG: RNA-binding domain-containing protein [Patescibacteria group bacterium]